jgi:hypothetical protein
MKYLLMFFIRLYWLIPKSYRRSCIFKESCSHYVFNATEASGFKVGIKAFKARYNQCRRGYFLFECEDQRLVVLADKTVIQRNKTRL